MEGVEFEKYQCMVWMKESNGWNGTTQIWLRKKRNAQKSRGKVSRIMQGHREAWSWSQEERLNDGKSGRRKGAKGLLTFMTASHSQLKILTCDLSLRPMTYPHQRILGPERIHHCRWGHNGWRQPRRLCKLQPGQTGQRTGWLISRPKMWAQSSRKSEAGGEFTRDFPRALTCVSWAGASYQGEWCRFSGH